MKVKSAYIGFILIVLMLGSTFAFAALQVGFTGRVEKVKLPKENIIDYELTSQQENALIKNGMTIIKFYYNLVCENCLEQKSFLEQIASSQVFRKQIFLEEIISSGDKKLPSMSITSYNGQRTLMNATSDKIISVLCEILINPPLECALREV